MVVFQVLKELLVVMYDLQNYFEMDEIFAFALENPNIHRQNQFQAFLMKELISYQKHYPV